MSCCSVVKRSQNGKKFDKVDVWELLQFAPDSRKMCWRDMQTAVNFEIAFICRDLLTITFDWQFEFHRLSLVHKINILSSMLFSMWNNLHKNVASATSVNCSKNRLPRVGPGHPSSPLVHLLPHHFPLLLFPFFHWLYLFSFVHPFPFYQNSPTPFPGRRS